MESGVRNHILVEKGQLLAFLIRFWILISLILISLIKVNSDIEFVNHILSFSDTLLLLYCPTLLYLETQVLASSSGKYCQFSDILISWSFKFSGFITLCVFLADLDSGWSLGCLSNVHQRIQTIVRCMA